MRIIRYYIYTACLLMTACHSSMERQLNKVDELLNQYPDSALFVLKQIDTSRLAGDNDRAYYHLLYSVALDKNYIDVADDSLINLSANYYEIHGNKKNRMRSHYYQGIVRKNAGNYPAAIVSFEKAEQEANSLHDLHHLGLIHRNMGTVFNSTHNFIEARKHFRKAIDCFSDNQDSLYAQHAIYALAVSFFNNGDGFLNNHDLDSCQHYLRSLLNTCGNSQLRISSLKILSYINVIKRDSLQQALTIFRTMPNHLLDVRDYGYYALALARTGQIDSARRCMVKAYNVTRSPSELALLNSIVFRLDTLEGHYKNALQKVTGAMATQDSITRVLLQHSLSVAQKDYYQHENTIQENRIQRQRLVYVTICILSSLMLMVIFLLIYIRKKNQEAQMKEQMALLAVTQQEIRKGNGTLVGVLFMEKLARLFGLSVQYYETGNDLEKTNALLEFKKIAKELKETPDLFLELENNLNMFCSGIMDKLKDQVPGIRGNNRRIIALFFAGIPDPVLQIIMQRVSVGSLRTLRSRFRQAIKDAHAPDEILFLDMLDIEKQPGRKQKNE